jgi:3-deoxy-manno-octulosonate cytidylyltransferase (CMP-KDO synthetase)
MKKVIAVIPARFGSTRFPGKPLSKILDKPMIQHVYERAKQSKELDEIIVATDHQEIFNVVSSFGGKVLMTKTSHESGSDRMAEVAEKVDGDIFLNIQGDEPLIEPKLIDLIVQESKKHLNSVITAKKRIDNGKDIDNPNIVKVVTDKNNNALYFSRSPIPYNRSGREFIYYKHIGIYCYPKEILKKYVQLPKSSYEMCELLEQLRLLENGFNIKVIDTNYDSIGVDTIEDIKKVEKILEAMYK